MSENLPRWIFDNLGNGMASGPNAGPTVEFRNNPSYFLAREALQNSVDAWDPKSEKPVRVVFDVKEIDSHFLPGAQEMVSILNACSKYLNSKGSTEMAKELTSSANRIKNNKKISILRISDYNTIGMTDENWFRFGESVGFSNKGSGSGGSFGLGKGAYYSSSGFFSIFTASLYNDVNFRFSGKAILTTFELAGIRKQNNGTFGLEDQRSIPDKNLISKEFKDEYNEIFERKENGTDFLIPQFIGEDNWEDELTKSILRFFWLPILQNKLTVEINGESILSAESLEKNLIKYFKDESQEKVDPKRPNPIPFYYAYTEGEKSVEKIDGLGEVNLYLLTKDGYPNKIALIRKAGMVVDFQRKVSMNNFAAVFICDNDDGNALLREMENQEHNEWDPENAKTKESREKAKKAYAALDSFLKEKIQSLSASKEKKYLKLEGLDEYIYMDSAEDDGESESEEGVVKNIESADVSSVENIKNIFPEEKIKPLKIALKPDSITEDGGEEIDVIPKKPTKPKPVPPKPNPFPLVKPEKHKIGDSELKLKPIKKIRFESFVEKTASNNYIYHIIALGTPLMCIDELSIRIGTDESFDDVKIIEAKKKEDDTKYLIGENGCLKNLELNDAGSLHLLVKFEENDKFSLKILGYENR